MKKIKINDIEYEIIRNDADCIDPDVLKEKITDYFDDFDYIFGDYAYEKVRLKGFYDSMFREKHLKNVVINNCFISSHYLLVQTLTQIAHLFGLIFFPYGYPVQIT